MMKNFQLIIFTCFFSFNIWSQNTKDLKGRIVDSKTKEVIAYAAIGLIKANQGISSNEKGDFIFKTVSIDDTLIASCVGYSTVIIAVMDFKSEIELTPSVIELKTVTINPKKSKAIDINGFEKKNMGYDISSNVVKMMQIAQFIENFDGKTWYLKEIKIGRRKKTALGKNQKTQFKVRFYGVDSLGKPDSKDIFEALLVKNESDRIIKINIENKKLVLPKNGLFVAIEWIKIPENYVDEKYKSSVTRGGIDVGKETIIDRFYTPMISARKPYEKDKNCRVYELDYKGIWEPKCFQVPFDNNGFSNNLNISVSVYD